MRHQPAVFGALLQEIPWRAFDRLAEACQADDGVRRFDSRDHLIAMLGAALGGLHGLRQTVAGLLPGSGPLRLIGRRPPRRSTLAEAHRRRDARLFIDLPQAMLPRLRTAARRDVCEAVRLIDSTQVNLGPRLRRWIGLHRGEPTAEIHVAYDPRTGQPTYFDLTSARTNDITAAKRRLPIEPGATYVFDLGHHGFAWWGAPHGDGCRFVTRLKRNTPRSQVERRPVAAGGAALSERTGRLPERLARSRRNPFGQIGREAVSRISTGRTPRLFTNDLDSPAEAIANLDKERWQIELFFKRVKPNLRIGRVMGNSGNAVRVQVATALIACIPLRLAQIKQATTPSASSMLTVTRGPLFTRRPIAHLLDPPPRQRPPPGPQLTRGSCKQ